MKKLALVIFLTGVAQMLPMAARAQGHPTTPAGRPASRSKEAESGAAEARRQAALQRVRGLVERVQNFKNDELKIRTLVTMADALWRAEGDEAYARQLFLQAYELLKAGGPPDASGPAQTALGGAPARPRRGLGRPYLRTFLIQKLARHDIELAKQLAADNPAGGGQALAAEQNLSVAFSLAEEGDASTVKEFTRQGLEGVGITRSNAMLVLSVLGRLRVKDEKSANELFLFTLSRLTAHESAGVDELLIIGNYLFSSSLSLASETEGNILVTPIAVGKVGLPADISLDRPNVNPELARAYLEAASRVLKRMADPAQMQRYAAASHLLLPKARRFAPGLAPTFAELSATLGYVPPPAPDIIKPGVGDTAGVPDVEGALRKGDSIADEVLRDEFYLGQVKSYYGRGEFEAARRLASRVSAAQARAKLLDLINFRQAVSLSGRGDFVEAERLLSKVGPGTEIVLGRLALAGAYLNKGDNAGARYSLNKATKEVASVQSEELQGGLLVAAARVFAGFDAISGANLLRQAVQTFNRGKGVPPNRPGMVSVGKRTVTFDVSVKGVAPDDYYGALRPLADADPDGTVAAVLGLENESRLGLFIHAMVRALLPD